MIKNHNQVWRQLLEPFALDDLHRLKRYSVLSCNGYVYYLRIIKILQTATA